MSAFLRLIERRPELDIRLNMVGAVTPGLAVPVSLLAKRAKGRILLHGWLPDGQIRALIRRARATVFVSLAEGYGLPVAESLWYGKPCLCSGEGSMGEIARGGGCLTVNPGSLDEIEAGFETLATDAARYEELLGQIAARRMKTWKQYAGEIVEEFAALASGEPRASALAIDVDGPPEARHRGRRRALARDAIFLVAASDLSVPADFAAAGRRRLASIEALRSATIGIATETFSRTYCFSDRTFRFPAGAYAFSFEGEIEGELAVAFTGNSGRTKIGEASLDSFTRSVSIDLPEAVEKFEIVGMKTPGLKRLILRGAFAYLREHAPRTESEPFVGSTELQERPSAESSIPALEALYSNDDSRIQAVDDDGQDDAPALRSSRGKNACPRRCAACRRVDCVRQARRRGSRKTRFCSSGPIFTSSPASTIFVSTVPSTARFEYASQGISRRKRCAKSC